jgi:hypothetical protein
MRVACAPVRVIKVRDMRVRLIALIASLTAMAMLIPAIGTGLGRMCESEMLTAGQCCCEDGDAIDQGQAPPTVDSACCCEVRQAPVDVGTSTALSLSNHSDPAPESVVAVSFRRIDRPLTCASLVRLQPRGPPPLRTLLAQRTALIC